MKPLSIKHTGEYALENFCYAFPYTNYSIRNLNRWAILELIQFTPGGISRVELARRIDLTRSTVSTIVTDLLQKKLVREAASGPTTGGRRPILLELNPERGYVLGIDMGATHLEMVVTDFLARVISEVEIPFDVNQGPEACLQALDGHTRELLDRTGLGFADIISIGLGVPGPVVSEAGIVSAPPIMPGWDGYPIRDDLQRRWGPPISMSNDAELGALGEWAFGAGHTQRHMAYIKVGSGVGAGLILNGRIYRGAAGLAGEIGHLTIQENGPLCTCGNQGCLEALSGGAAIARQAVEAVSSGERTQLSKIQPHESISAQHVANAARRGDLVAQRIIAQAGEYLGIAIASVINFSNPNVVVIGGGVAQMGDLLLEPIRRVVQERSLSPSAKSVSITAAVLGRRSSVLGAIVQAVNSALYEFTEGNLATQGGAKEQKEEEKEPAFESS
ncbi:MAG: ROK family transcriptional regulator [Chloroflexota bacterium]|nr:ROK family transcriptional regulator [Chloroflexota bacterium]